MPIGDTSNFSTILDGLWDALEDVAPLAGQNLRDWRTEQTSGGTSTGRNFRSGPIPTDPMDVAADDLPALFLDDEEPLPQLLDQPGGTSVFLWPIDLVGIVFEDAATWDRLMKARKFCELCYKLLALSRTTCFGISGDVVNGARITGMEFGGVEEASERRASFTISLELEVKLTS